jgi:DNA repair protein RecN (Recombination protein N)
MLINLSIQNFALIKDIAIDFENNMSIITGETGAGKSIILGALSLIMGKRADLDVVRDKKSKCIIETYFKITKKRFKAFFDDHDLDFDEECIIRREILPSGKSRAFINDSPVKLNALQQLSKHLIDIHSQHQTLDLNDENYQYNLIDAVASNESLLKKYQTAYLDYTTLLKRIQDLEKSKQEAQKNLDYNNFLLNELKEIELESVDLNVLETKQNQLSNVNLIKEELAKVHQILDHEEIGVLEQLNESYRSLSKISEFGDKLKQFAERINSCIIELQDLDQSIENQADQLEDDPLELEKTNQQLQHIYKLQEKHQAADITELIDIKNQLEDQVFTDSNIDREIEKLKNQSEKLREDCLKLAEKLTKNRKSAAKVIIKHVENQLALLGINEAKFLIDITKSEQLNRLGKDSMQWKFSANKGADPKSLAKIASGGELSRISLSLKNLLAQKSKLPTLIFDEIDTGVSGDIAVKMGNIMKEMGNNMQLVCITHLPQIAAKGKQHYKVYKYTEDDKTFSNIQKLNEDQRIKEITNMLGGDANSQAAKSHAQTLFNN